MATEQYIAGFKDLDKALAELPNAVAKRTLNAAMTKAAKPTLAEARNSAETFHNPGIYRTGQLAASLKISTRLSPRQRKSVGSQLPGTATIYVGASWPMGAHAHFKEFGTSRQPSEPFLRPAWDQHQSGFVDTFKVELWKSIERARKRLAKLPQGSK